MGQDLMHVALIHKKVNEGRLQEPVSFRFTFHPGAVTVAEEPIGDIPDFVSDLPMAEQLVAAFKDHGPQSAKDMSTMLGLNLGSVQVTLSRDSRFRRIGNNRWDVT